MSRYIQKLVKNGNSTMVTIPRPLLRALAMVAGGNVVLALQEDGSLKVSKLVIPGATVVGQSITLDEPETVQR